MQPKPQSQASLTDQLTELIDIANREGLYDAADFIAKQLKPPGWQPPDIAGVLRDHGWES